MYILPNKLKLFSIALIVVGFLGIALGFFNAPKNIDDVKKLNSAHQTEHVVATSHDATTGHDSDGHLTHQLHQLQNRPWAATYVAALFFALLSLGVLAFYGIQHASQAGWSIVLLRVMEGITAYVLPGTVIVLLIAIFSGHHIFIWRDAEVVAHDKLLQGKSGFLNLTGFIIRGVIFIAGWVSYRYFSRKMSIAQDEAADNTNFKRNFKASAAFLVFFIVTESIMSWDWIMSVEPHWFSTLFGWYVFASFFVSGITTIALITLYLKSKGYLEIVNRSHIQDLAKFMFAFSIFWAYLWFSQFMLIWYANIPEEITYFATRIEHYNLPFFGAVVMNFVFPILILMNADFKKLTWIVVMAGVIVLAGHYIDFYNMIMPGTVGTNWSIGVPEVGAVLFFLGLFILVVFTALSKAPLVVKRNPFVHESEHFHY